MKKKNENYPAEDEIRIVLEREIVEPFIRSVCSDLETSIKLSAALVLTRYTEQIIFKKLDDEDMIYNKVKEYNLFLGYFGKIYQSSLFSLGSTDYLSSLILLRALFELLVGISTEEKGVMSIRIKSISFLDAQEKKDLTKTWNSLCAWAHPYGKWVKRVCPIAFGKGRIYNPNLFNQSVLYSHKILDFMLVTIFETLNLSKSDYLDSPASFIYDELPMFYKRLEK